MRIWTQKSASIQKRTSPLKFDNFAEKSEKDTVSYLSTKDSTHDLERVALHVEGARGVDGRAEEQRQHLIAELQAPKSTPKGGGIKTDHAYLRTRSNL